MQRHLERKLSRFSARSIRARIALGLVLKKYEKVQKQSFLCKRSLFNLQINIL